MGLIDMINLTKVAQVSLLSSLMLLTACGDQATADTRSSEVEEQAAQKSALSNNTKTEPAAKKTASLRLPEKTNNVWEMKAFELPDTEDKKRTLSDWKGKVIMLNFWASWCAPCQFEIPRFVGYQKKYADQGLQIIGIGLDDVNKLKNVERSLEMNYPTMVIDQEGGAALLEQWGNDQQIVPYTVVIASDGTIVYIHRGGLEDDDFERYVLPLLQKKQ
jgi:peroxiredoxin/outer membrane murein-binding lipoprotein Lpp